MIYKNVKIYFWCINGGLCLNSKRVFCSLVYDPTGKKVYLDSTCKRIQHELEHTKKIKEKGWIDFTATTLWQYIWKKHDEAGYEPDAEKVEVIIDQVLRFELTKYCTNNNLEFY